jgi:predicted ATPase/class 3 adenylate cyclase/Tfp pilus assembly protein PilF
MKSALPTGTVTFLFTDIEGSTALWAEFPDAMRVALGRHDALLRHAIEQSCGHVFKKTGDGMYAVFGTAKDALAACIAAQRALQAPAAGSAGSSAASDTRAPIALRVRMGLLSGTAELRDDDYFGASLNRTARIMSVAHGEQVLLSATTAELLRGQLPEGVALRDLGEHRLKGVPDPERLLQVVAPGLREDFPPLASQTGRSLPAERDAFVGRRETLVELTRRFNAGARLVTVLGVGGTGKTRLVTRFGWSSPEDFPGGVWFCDLAQARSVDGILHAVALGLNVPLGNEDPVTQLGRAIAGRDECLVILDNFEQVARHADETIGRWLDWASSARFLVTTREVLGLPGEEILALAPLSVTDAAELFMLRAQSARPGFEPHAEDRAAIGPLVKLLDGLPLAIELAAARLRVMSARTLLLRMSERFRLLASTGARLDRQATLRGVFDWSWDLLSSPEKAALAQLSVFEGGFTLEAVEAVVDLSAYDNALWLTDALQSLVQKSLVRQVTDDRFDLLVSLKEYASEHLRTEGRYAGSGPAARLAAELRHGVYFSRIGLEARGVIANVAVDLDNLIAACRRAAARGDADMAANALQGAWAALYLRGPFGVGVELASLVQAVPGLGSAAAAGVAWVAGVALSASGKHSQARNHFEASITRAREVADRRRECRALVDLGFQEIHASRADSARVHLETALVIARDLDDRALQSDAENKLGNLEASFGEPRKALAHYEAALALAREARNRNREANVLGNLAIQHSDMGNIDEALAHNQAALAVAREVGDRRLEGNVLCNLGLLYQLRGRFSDALDQLDAALVVARDLGHVLLECLVLCNLGMVYDSLGRFDEARDRFATALAIARDMKHQRSEGQVLGYQGLLYAHQASFDDARRSLDAGEALLRAVSDRMSLGILLCSRAETERRAGNPDAASAALSDAEAIAAEVAAGEQSELGLAIVRVRKLVG